MKKRSAHKRENRSGSAIWRFFKKIFSGIKTVLNKIFPGINVVKAFFSGVHSIWLIGIALLWLGHVNFLDGFEFMNDYINMRSFVKEYILQKPPETDFADKVLLLNTSRNNALVPLDNDNTINTVITDRRVLAEKLKILDENSDSIRFIICDIYFEMASADKEADSLLQAVILSLSAKNKFAMPGFYNDQSKTFHKPVFEGTAGLSQYRSSFLNNQFLKYSFIQYNHQKQIPLIAFESITGTQISRKKLGFITYYTNDNQWVLNTIIPEFRYAQSNLKEGENYFQLGLFEDYLIQDGQLVIIGDFEGANDVHHSMAGLNSGPIVLLNVITSLLAGDNKISWSYRILLFIVFFYVSFHSFYFSYQIVSGKTLKSKIIYQLIDKRIYLLLLMLVYISMIFFHHYIHILILLTYFGLLDFVEHYIVSVRR